MGDMRERATVGDLVRDGEKKAAMMAVRSAMSGAWGILVASQP